MIHDDAPPRGPFHDWYETWRAEQAAGREAAGRERTRHRRDDRRLAILLGAYMAAGGLLAALAVRLVLAN